MRKHALHRAAVGLTLLGVCPGVAFGEECRSFASRYARLACFERQVFIPVQNNSSAHCFSQQNEQLRLACFEGKPSAEPPAATSSSGTARQPPAATSSAPRNRAEITIGYTQGNYDGTIKSSLSGNQLVAHTDSLVGSDGKMLTAAYWRDGAIGKRFSLGIEYLHFKNEAKLSADTSFNGLSIGGSTLNGSGSGQARAELLADIGMLNVAYRPVLSEGWHPFLGLGLGAGYGELNITGDLHIAGTLSENFHAESILVATQGFFGTEIDITDNLYATLGARLILITARPAGIDQQFQNIAVNSGLGWRF